MSEDEVFDPLRRARDLFRRLRGDQAAYSNELPMEDAREVVVSQLAESHLGTYLEYDGKLSDILNKFKNREQLQSQLEARLDQVYAGGRLARESGKVAKLVGRGYLNLMADVADYMHERGVVDKQSHRELRYGLNGNKYIPCSTLVDEIENGLVKDKLSPLTPKEHRFSGVFRRTVQVADQLLGIKTDEVKLDVMLSEDIIR